jgi:hypothetical protein
MQHINATQINLTMELMKQIRPYEKDFSFYFYFMCALNTLMYILSMIKIVYIKVGTTDKSRPILIHGLTAFWIASTFTTLLQPIGLLAGHSFYTIGATKVCFCGSSTKILPFLLQNFGIKNFKNLFFFV